MSISPIPKGSTGPPLQFSIVTDTPAPLNLTGATMLPLTIKNAQTNVEQIGAGAWSIINAVGGIAQYTLNAADTATVGQFVLIISFTLGGLTYICDSIPWTVSPT